MTDIQYNIHTAITYKYDFIMYCSNGDSYFDGVCIDFQCKIYVESPDLWVPDMSTNCVTVTANQESPAEQNLVT